MIVTIVTPTLNAREHFRECIESARMNESNDIQVEHIIVDGGSVDGTVELAESYGLRVLKGKDRGIFDAINKGSFDSSGDLLGFLGADDIMLKGALEQIVRAYRKNNRRWVVGGIRWIDEHGRSLGNLAAPPSWMTPRMHVCLDWNPIMHMATYFSRDFFTALGGFNIDYKDAGDFEMFARALSKEPYERVPVLIACFRRTGMNNSVVNSERANREIRSVCGTFGPKSNLERACWRYLLKAWFNFRNPQWLVRKLSDSLCARIGLQEKTYY
jgi:glycosyltransferase involved in cell wall biosynthesis